MKHNRSQITRKTEVGLAWKPLQREWRSHLEKLFANSLLAHRFRPSQQLGWSRAVNLQSPELGSCPCSRGLPHQCWLCCLLQNALPVPQAVPAQTASVAYRWGLSVSQIFSTKKAKMAFSLTNTCYRYVFILSKDALLLSFFFSKKLPPQTHIFICSILHV